MCLPKSTYLAPCGAIANSLFNDTFFLYDCDDDDCTIDDNTIFNRVINPAQPDLRIPMTGQDIAWQTDKVKIVLFELMIFFKPSKG